jgi:peptidoglycan-N-acetylmuramic acid deacetylase
MVRKLYLIAGLYAVCVIGAVLSGCSIYDKEDMSKMIATPGDAECQADGAKNGEGDAEGKEKSGDKTEDAESNTDTDGESQGEDMTRLRDYSQISTKKYSWYIVRDKNHGMSGCDNSFPLEQYDAFYVDRVCAEKNEKVMYLTFDCGYENGYTEQMLDVLKKHNAKGCFFVTMTYIRDNPDIVKRMKEEGHQVGNHTVHHPCMPEKSVEEQKSELKECSDFMRNETGYEMDMYFRPPCGEYSEQVLQLAKDMGYKTIFWSMAYLDYDVNNQPGTDYVIDHFAKYHHPGAIPLIHNVSSSNAQALDTVLTNLEKEGYEFRSLNEMKIE